MAPEADTLTSIDLSDTDSESNFDVKLFGLVVEQETNHLGAGMSNKLFLWWERNP